MHINMPCWGDENFVEIRPNAATPLYDQIATVLRRKIVGGVWTSGNQIPSEPELTEEFRVSRVTVRGALNVLVQEGLIRRVQGKGTFVSSSSSTTEQLERMVSLSDAFKSKGLNPRVQVIKSGVIKSSDVPMLSGDHQEAIFFVRRHIVNEETVAVSLIHLPYAYGRVMSAADIETNTTYALLETRCGLKPISCNQFIRAGLADHDVAQWLEVGQGFPILITERTTFAEDEEAIEHILIHFRADRYQYSLRMRASDVGPVPNLDSLGMEGDKQ